LVLYSIDYMCTLFASPDLAVTSHKTSLSNYRYYSNVRTYEHDTKSDSQSLWPTVVHERMKEIGTVDVSIPLHRPLYLTTPFHINCEKCDSEVKAIIAYFYERSVIRHTFADLSRNLKSP